MKNGLKATCIKYVQWDDIDIQFEDGTIVRHKAKSSFYKGEIKHPTINAITAKSSCLGETRAMKNGLAATCIEYIDSKHLSIRFEDGTIVKNKSKREFYLGTIGNPNIGVRITSHRSLVGQRKIMNCGLYATVIADRSAKDVDVKFEDGVTVEHRERADFRNGTIAHPYYALRSFPQQLVLSSIRKYFPDALSDYRPDFMRNNLTNKNLELDIWVPSKNVGIEYDGYPWHKNDTQQSKAKFDLVVSSDKIVKLYSLIEEGCVVHKSDKHINFILKNNNNLESLYEEIRISMISILKDLGVEEPDLIFNEKFLDEVRLTMNEDHIGEKTKMKNGQIATIVVYRSVGDIDVQFEDGTVVKHRRMQNFYSGEIKNPNYDPSSILGMKLKMLNGLYAVCVRYGNSKDIDIQFEDGTIVTNKAKNNFLRGKIAHPNIDPYNQTRKSIVGEKRLMNCGLYATCIAYRTSTDLDVQFEDGTIVKKRTKQQFFKGSIKSPVIKKKFA